MIVKIDKDKMFVSNQGWLESRFHFSFAEYRDFHNMNFGVLRVLNDDIVHPESGFPMHPHRDMEIISYIVDGEITHKDSMGNERTLGRGEVQYMSAGDGVYHSEYNNHKTDDLRLLQIWIMPPRKGLDALYGDVSYEVQERKNRLLHIVSDKAGDAKVKIHQDVNIYVSELDNAERIDFPIKEGRQIYYVQIEGSAEVNGVHVTHGDALKITDEKSLKIKAVDSAHFLFIEMQQ
ncbi:pirin family protein [bacterium]|nr:pirin family protein [bacterium]MBU1882797.1 pirin family protein [bacterium]